jgi:MFS family permease
VKPSPERLRANVARIQAMSFAWMFMLIMPVIVPFLKGRGLSMEEIMRLQAIFAISVVVLEVPSGYVSDMLGRKRCLVLAGLLHGVAFSLLAWTTSFEGLAVYQLTAALGVSLYSGSDVALLYDSLEALDDHEGRRRLLGRRLLWMQSGETAAALIGGALVWISLQTVALVNAVAGWLPFLVALTLVEVPRATLARGRHLENMRLIVVEIFGRTRLLRLIMLNLIAYGLATLLAVWVFQGIWEATGVPLWAFGFLWAGYNLVVAFVGRAAHRVEDRLGAARTAGLIGVLPVAGYVGMALCALGAGPLAAAAGVLCGFAFQVSRGLTQVILKDALNTRVPTELRATANSISSLGVRLAFALLGPALGWMIDNRGYPSGLAAAAALFLVVMLWLNRALVNELGDMGSMSYPEGP